MDCLKGERQMKEEYNYTLTVPMQDVNIASEILAQAKADTPLMRISRKPDRREFARFYLSFPFSGHRTDLAFAKWFATKQRDGWDLFGPNYGIWGLS
jgi:hypothetical protein